MLEPWKGYWIRNRGGAPAILSVPPWESEPENGRSLSEEEMKSLRFQRLAGPVDGGLLWAMRVSVWADGFSQPGDEGSLSGEGIGKTERLGDPDNFIGISEGAAQGWDRRDLSEPPVIGPSLALYFPHPDWEGHPTRLAGDFRPYEGGTLTWDFLVEAADTDLREATLTFERVADVPEGLRVILLDPEREERIDD